MVGALLAAGTILAGTTGGCGTRSTTPSPTTLGRAASCRLADALHEAQFAASPGLRASLRDTVVGRLETPGGSTPASDSANPGADAIPYRIEGVSEIEIGVGPGTIASARLLDENGRTVGEARSGGPAMRTPVASGDYTLLLVSDGSGESHYVAQPSECARAGAQSSDGARAARSIATPGIYVQEIGSAPPSVTGAPTSIAAFVGAVGSGPIGQPIQLWSMQDWTSSFTLESATTPVGVAVSQFFAGGGSSAWVVGTASASAEDLAGTPAATSGVYALGGIEGWSILVMPDVASLSTSDAVSVLSTAIPFATGKMAFTVIDPPLAAGEAEGVAGWVVGSLVPALPSASRSFAAVYYPQIVVREGSIQTEGPPPPEGGGFAGG